MWTLYLQRWWKSSCVFTENFLKCRATFCLLVSIPRLKKGLSRAAFCRFTLKKIQPMPFSSCHFKVKCEELFTANTVRDRAKWIQSEPKGSCSLRESLSRHWKGPPPLSPPGPPRCRSCHSVMLPVCFRSGQRDFSRQFYFLDETLLVRNNSSEAKGTRGFYKVSFVFLFFWVSLTILHE